MAIRDVVQMDLPAFRRFVRRTPVAELAEWLDDRAWEGIRGRVLPEQAWVDAAFALKRSRPPRGLLRRVWAAGDDRAATKAWRIARNAPPKGAYRNRTGRPSVHHMLQAERLSYGSEPSPYSGLSDGQDLWSEDNLWHDWYAEEYEGYRESFRSAYLEQCHSQRLRGSTVLLEVIQEIQRAVPKPRRERLATLFEAASFETWESLKACIAGVEDTAKQGQDNRTRQSHGRASLERASGTAFLVSDGARLAALVRARARQLWSRTTDLTSIVGAEVSLPGILGWLGRVVDAESLPTRVSAVRVVWTVIWLLRTRPSLLERWQRAHGLPEAWAHLLALARFLASQEDAESVELATTWLRSDLTMRQLDWARQDEAMIRRSASQPQVWESLASVIGRGAGTVRHLPYPPLALVCSLSADRLPPKEHKRMSTLERQIVDFLNDLRSARSIRQLRRVIDHHIGSNAFSRASKGTRLAIAQRMAHSFFAFIRLVSADGVAPERVNGRRVRRFWLHERVQRRVHLRRGYAAAERRAGSEIFFLGLAYALRDLSRQQFLPDRRENARLKDDHIHALRMLAIAWSLEQGAQDIDLVARLHSAVTNGPMELDAALGRTTSRGLPKRNSGDLSQWEIDYRKVLRSQLDVRIDRAALPTRLLTLRPLPKTEALFRGYLAGDCSSASVPMRALLPHCTFYGVWEGARRIRGYVTVVEVWATHDDGARVPALMLETVNLPGGELDVALDDLLVVLEAVAAQRGLPGGVVVSVGRGTWNFQFEDRLRKNRRFRNGRPVVAEPADLAAWALYDATTREGERYTAFAPNARGFDQRPMERSLARCPGDAEVHPTNLSEAERIRRLPRCEPIETARDDSGRAGFISEWPVCPSPDAFGVLDEMWSLDPTGPVADLLF